MPRAKRLYYLIAFILLFCVEFAIATYLKGGFIRGYLGDLLVVILVYAGLMTVSILSVKTGLLTTGIVALSIELLQLIDLTQYFEGNAKKVATLVLGSHYSWLDLLMYALGILLVWLLERAKQ